MAPVAYDQQTLQMCSTYPARQSSNTNIEPSQTLIAVRNNQQQDVNTTIDGRSNETVPHYFVLEREENNQSEAIYDVVYQNAWSQVIKGQWW